MAAWKRQRDEEHKKENDWKWKCTEESERLKQEQDTQLNSNKDMGKARVFLLLIALICVYLFVILKIYTAAAWRKYEKGYRNRVDWTTQQPKEIDGQIANVTDAAELGPSINKVTLIDG